MNGSVYRCLVQGDNTSETPSGSASLIINTFPDATISLNGTLLTASAGDSYQWYQNGSIITGEINQTLELNVLEYGEYVVEVTTNGCSSMSLNYIYLITGTEPSGPQISIFPNPFTNELRIAAPENLEVGLTILDVTGRTIKRFEQVKQSVQVFDLPAGVYLIRVETSGKSAVRKLLKR